jgi:chromosome segregation ATPase
MATISTDIPSSSAAGGIAGRQPDILISQESVSRLPSTTGSEFDSETKLVQDVGSRLHEYETTNQQLHADLLDAANEKQHLVDALRDLHREFHSLQRHTDKQREILVSEGEELRACRRRIAVLRIELAAVRADYERSTKQEDVNETSTNAGKYDYVVASYRDALRDMRRNLAKQQAAFASQKKAQVELLRKMQSLERRAEEFDGQHDQRRKPSLESAWRTGKSKSRT